MDNNNQSSLDRKVALKLVNQYAESYKTLQTQNKILEDNIKDLKINLKINKEMLSKFITKNNSHQINQNILTKLNEHINQLTNKNEEISNLNISLLTQQNLLNQQISFLKEDIDSKSQQIFILEQSLQKKDNIIATFKKKIKPSNPPFIVIDPSQAVIAINDELLTYKTIYKKVSKYLQRNCERINKYENLITDLQTENGKLRTQNKLQLYSANRERTLLVKLKDEFCNKSNNNTLNTNMTDNNTCVSSYTQKGRMKLGINNLEDKMREKLELKTAKSVTCGGQNDLDMTSKLESEEFNEILKMAGMSLDHFIMLSKNKLYSKLTDAIEFMYKIIVEKNMCINLLEIENENLNAKNYQLNRENMELTAESKKKTGLGDSMINNTSQITINNVSINTLNRYKQNRKESINNNNDKAPADRNVLTLESVTSSEFKNECNQLASFTSDNQEHNYLDQIEIKKM